ISGCSAKCSVSMISTGKANEIPVIVKEFFLRSFSHSSVSALKPVRKKETPPRFPIETWAIEEDPSDTSRNKRITLVMICEFYRRDKRSFQRKQKARSELPIFLRPFPITIAAQPISNGEGIDNILQALESFERRQARLCASVECPTWTFDTHAYKSAEVESPSCGREGVALIVKQLVLLPGLVPAAEEITHTWPGEQIDAIRLLIERDLRQHGHFKVAHGGAAARGLRGIAETVTLVQVKHFGHYAELRVDLSFEMPADHRT